MDSNASIINEILNATDETWKDKAFQSRVIKMAEAMRRGYIHRAYGVAARRSDHHLPGLDKFVRLPPVGGYKDSLAIFDNQEQAVDLLLRVDPTPLTAFSVYPLNIEVLVEDYPKSQL